MKLVIGLLLAFTAAPFGVSAADSGDSPVLLDGAYSPISESSQILMPIDELGNPDATRPAIKCRTGYVPRKCLGLAPDRPRRYIKKWRCVPRGQRCPPIG